MNTNDADTLFRLTQDEIRGKIARCYRDEPGTTWGELINHSTRDILFFLPGGSATTIKIETRQDGTFLVYANDQSPKDISTFKHDRPLEAEALDLYCRLPIEITERGFSMFCVHSYLQHLAPLFVLFLQTLSAARKLRNLEGLNNYPPNNTKMPETKK